MLAAMAIKSPVIVPGGSSQKERERKKKYGEKNEQDDHWGNEGRYPILFSFTSYQSF